MVILISEETVRLHSGGCPRASKHDASKGKEVPLEGKVESSGTTCGSAVGSVNITCRGVFDGPHRPLFPSGLPPVPPRTEYAAD